VLWGWNLADRKLGLHCALARTVFERFDLPAGIYPNPMGGVVDHAGANFRIVSVSKWILPRLCEKRPALEGGRDHSFLPGRHTDDHYAGRHSASGQIYVLRRGLPSQLCKRDS
jgi:hypothetical protein